MTSRDFSEQVGRGAALLDRVKPDWWQLVRENRLDMSDGYMCILAQVYRRGYSLSLEEVGLCRRGLPAILLYRLGASRKAYAHGFDLPSRPERAAWNALADAWRVEIRLRREMAAMAAIGRKIENRRKLAAFSS